MQSEQRNMKRPLGKWGGRTGLVIVILAAVLLEGIAAIQYYYTRGLLERNLEQQVLGLLRAAAIRLDGNLNSTVAQAQNQVWHAQQRLDSPDYMETMVANLVKNGSKRVVGAAVLFRPDFFPQKGRWFEPYARLEGNSVRVEQIGSASHNYEQLDFYQSCMRGDTVKWSVPYMDKDGAKGVVTTYALPLRQAGDGEPVAVMAIDVTTDWIVEALGDIRLHPSSVMLVLSEGGDVIAAPTDSTCSQGLATRIAAMMGDPAVKKDERAGGRVTCFHFYDEEKKRQGRVYYARKKFEPNWLMVEVVYDDEAFGELEQMRRNILWLSLAGLLVLGLIIHLFARNERRLQNSLLQQQRTEHELQIASSIQQALLPLDEPSLRDVGEVQVEGCLIPAREVGGDLYNVFVRDDKLFFCIGDVSGKGVPAALIMAVTQTLFHNIASQENNPATIMERMNATACRNNQSSIFATMFVGVLDLRTGHLDYCNAGHERPLLGGQPLDVVPNMPIGLFDDFAYEKQEATMTSGETLFLYTDGLTEARNAQRQLFGRERAIRLIVRCGGMTPKDTVEALVAEVKRYAEHTEQSDDLTLLAICYKPHNLITS